MSTASQPRRPAATYPASGWDALARYVLGFGTPERQDLDAALRFVNYTFDGHASADLAAVYRELWPTWDSYNPPSSTKALHNWRLTSAGVYEAEHLLASPSTSGRRALARAVLTVLLVKGAVPAAYQTRIRHMVTQSLPEAARVGIITTMLDSQQTWLPTETLNQLTLDMLIAADSGDPVRTVFKRVRAPVQEAAVGRVLWQMKRGGLVRQQRERPNRSATVLIPPADLHRRYRRHLAPPLSPVGSRIFNMHRRHTKALAEPTSGSGRSIRTVKEITRAVLSIPDPNLLGVSHEHVIRVNRDGVPITRRLDIAAWLGRDTGEEPTTWIEIVGPWKASGGSHLRLVSQIATAIEASADWRKEITLYIVIHTGAAILTYVTTAIEDAMKTATAADPHLAIRIVDVKQATQRPLWAAAPILSQRIGQLEAAL